MAFAAPAMPFVVTDGGFADISIRRRIELFPVRSTASTRSPHFRRSRSRAGSAFRRILPSLGFSSGPLLRRTCGRPLPDRAAFAPRSFGPWCHHGFSFRPRGFAPPRRVPPTPQAPSVLQLGAGPGVRRVSRRPGVASEEASARPAFPAGASPSKGFPSSAAVPGLPGHYPRAVRRPSPYEAELHSAAVSPPLDRRRCVGRARFPGSQRGAPSTKSSWNTGFWAFPP